VSRLTAPHQQGVTPSTESPVRSWDVDLGGIHKVGAKNDQGLMTGQEAKGILLGSMPCSAAVSGPCLFTKEVFTVHSHLMGQRCPVSPDLPFLSFLVSN